MKPLSIYIVLMALLPGLALVPRGVSANPQPTKTLAEDNPAISDRPSIRYDRGLIDVRTENVPLGRVLSELARQSGVQVSFADPVIARWPVSVSVGGSPLVEGIKGILNGFSYAIYRVADTSRVIVLSTQPDPARTGIKTASTERRRGSLTAAPEKRSPTTQDPAAVPFSHMPGEGVPPSLEAFQPLMRGEASSGSIAEVGRQVDPATELAKQQEHKEALLRRALEALSSEHKPMHAEAIDQLVGMEDPRATQALVEVASNSGTAADVKSRVQAVEALWRHAADLRFSDEVSVNALKQLAEDSNSQVAKVARRAVSSMEQYQQQQAH
jgi:hypothetical protein